MGDLNRARGLAGAPGLHIRASYLLERGMWRATCRDCGWHTEDVDRRRAASRFRLHHLEAIEVIDLTDQGGLSRQISR